MMNVGYIQTQPLPPIEVIVHPATKKADKKEKKKGKLNVAAYCRVSTDQEEQLTSYEAQITYYTDKIQSNPQWSLAGIFADEGITGVMTKKRDQFNAMIDMCRDGKIDMIITKSISRFARNLSKDKLKALLCGSITEILSAPDTEMQIVGIQSKIDTKNNEIIEIIRRGVESGESGEAIQEKCRQKHDEVSELQERLNTARAKQQMENAQTGQLREMYDAVSQIPGKFTEYDDEIVRIAVSKVKIISENKIQVTLFDSVTIESELKS